VWRYTVAFQPPQPLHCLGLGLGTGSRLFAAAQGPARRDGIYAHYLCRTYAHYLCRTYEDTTNRGGS
jgi:hypothetical protein